MPDLQKSGSFIGMAGMAVTAFLYFFSGLLAPLWAVLVLVAFWVVLFVLACRWFGTHPVRVFWLPLLAAVVWFAALNAGGAWLGWTA